MSEWLNFVRCPECDHQKVCSFDAEFENSFNSRRTCPGCGEFIRWKDSVERWVSESTWWKPSTWGAGRWERKNG